MKGEAEFVVLFEREYPAVVRTVSLIIGDAGAAEELTQEAFTRLYTRWTSVRGYERPGAWVRRVAVNLALSRRRRKKGERAINVSPASVSDAPGAVSIDVHRALLTLPKQQRAAIVLHYLDDLPVKDVAEHLRCSESTAKVHLHRARNALAVVLGEDRADVH